MRPQINVKPKLHITVLLSILCSCNSEEVGKIYRSFDYHSMSGIDLLENKLPRNYVQVIHDGDELNIFIHKYGCEVKSEKWIKKNNFWYNHSISIDLGNFENSKTESSGFEEVKYVFNDTLLIYNRNIFSSTPALPLDSINSKSMLHNWSVEVHTHDSTIVCTPYKPLKPLRKYSDSTQSWYLKYPCTTITRQVHHDTLTIKAVEHGLEKKSGWLNSYLLNKTPEFYVKDIDNRCLNSITPLGIKVLYFKSK